MEKRKSKHHVSNETNEEPERKKQRQDKASTNQANSLNSGDTILKQQNKMKKGKNIVRKSFKHSEKGHGKKQKTREETIKKPVSMQDLLSEKLKKVQASRVNTTTDKTQETFSPKLKAENVKPVELKANNMKRKFVVEAKVEITKSGNSKKDKKQKMAISLESPSKETANQKKKYGNNTNVATAKNERNKTGDTKSHMKKKKKEMTHSSMVNDSVEQVKGDHESINSQEEVDSEKAAIRMKKREKRLQKKLEKKRIKQEYADKAGTAKSAAVNYLDVWKNKKEDWKFLKVRQVWLLQNMYDQTLV